jgi:UDP-glucose 4-epimerase
VKTVLITGVAGFIGSNLAARLLAENGARPAADRFEVVGVDNLSSGLRENIPAEVRFHEADIRDPSLPEIFRGVDVVFHLAAKNCIADCQADPVETSDINVTGTVNVLEAARRAGVGKVVYAESAALYEGSRVFPTPETDVHPESFYATSKFAARHFAEAYARFHGLALTALRYFCVYGPAQDYRRTIPPVMSAFIIRLLQGRPPVIHGSGRKRRDFVFVDDINEFHLLCLGDPRTDGRTFNLGSGVSTSVLEVLELVTDLLGIRIDPVFRPDLPGEAETTCADIRAARELGWEPRTDLRTGLVKAIDYIRGEFAAGRIAP